MAERALDRRCFELARQIRTGRGNQEALERELERTVGELFDLRERWRSQEIEIRVCTSCHGLNFHDQVGNGPPLNPPQALRELLRSLPLETGRLFADGFESGDVSLWAAP